MRGLVRQALYPGSQEGQASCCLLPLFHHSTDYLQDAHSSLWYSIWMHLLRDPDRKSHCGKVTFPILQSIFVYYLQTLHPRGRDNQISWNVIRENQSWMWVSQCLLDPYLWLFLQRDSGQALTAEEKHLWKWITSIRRQVISHLLMEI